MPHLKKLTEVQFDDKEVRELLMDAAKRTSGEGAGSPKLKIFDKQTGKALDNVFATVTYEASGKKHTPATRGA